MAVLALANHQTGRELSWPRLVDLRLDDGSLNVRRGGLGGSDANTILSGDPERIRALWLEKRGEAEPVSLDNSLAVMLGCWTEPFNRQWFERLMATSVSRVGEALCCGRYEWRRCTLDGFLEKQTAVWEAKHTSAFATSEEVTERYMPQLQHNMAVAGVDRGFLSVIFGNHKFEVIEIAADWFYQLELLEAEADFWDCVVTGREPLPLAPPTPPRPVGFREVCIEGNNAWASAAADWLENREAVKTHAAACKTIKSLVEDDVARAFGHGIEAKRSRSGAVTIRELSK